MVDAAALIGALLALALLVAVALAGAALRRRRRPAPLGRPGAPRRGSMRRATLAQSLGLALLTLALLAPLALPAAPVAAQAAVTVTATGDPGQYEVVATGFDDEDVSTWLTGPSQQVQASDSHSTDSSGDVDFRLHIPRHFEPGRWAITVHGLDSGEEAVGYFEVEAREADLTLDVSPASGPPGTTFAFSGSGFEGGETVSYWLTGPDGATHEGGEADAIGGGGVVTFSYTIGAETQGGTWTMSAYGQSSYHRAAATFTVD
jgi:hypothetical protein